MKYTNLLGVFTLSILCFSCIKTEKPKPSEPVPVVVDTILTQEILLRKWEITYLSVNRYHGDTLKSYSVWEKGVGLTADGILLQRWGDANETYITFNSDNTFQHETAEGEPNGYMLDGVLAPNGTWSLLSPKSIELSTMLDSLPTQNTWRVTYEDSTIVTTILFPGPAVEDDTVVAHVLYELPSN